MKKLIALLSLTALCVMTFGPVLTVATTNGIGTSLTQDVSGGIAPNVLVSWVARGDGYGETSTQLWRDDSTDAGSQIFPSGQHEIHTTIAMCAIVESEYGIDYIDNVYADVFYPIDIALGAHHTKLPNQSGTGCGEFMQQDLLKRLTKANGITLFCNNVRNSNWNLPTWAYDEAYESLCGDTGKLHKEEAVVYCGKKTISYEDPNGYYKVMTLVQDQNGQSGTHNHGFTYVPVNAYNIDFSNVDYGAVKLNTTKIVSGDLTWDPSLSNKPTIRNVGNTRLGIDVWQDDMDLGKTSGNWNVRFGARIGHKVGFKNYYPEAWTRILDELDLSEKNEMDFSILVNKFPYPYPDGGFVGTLELSSETVDHLYCEPING